MVNRRISWLLLEKKNIRWGSLPRNLNKLPGAKTKESKFFNEKKVEIEANRREKGEERGKKKDVFSMGRDVE